MFPTFLTLKVDYVGVHSEHMRFVRHVIDDCEIIIADALSLKTLDRLAFSPSLFRCLTSSDKEAFNFATMDFFLFVSKILSAKRNKEIKRTSNALNAFKYFYILFSAKFLG